MAVEEVEIALLSERYARMQERLERLEQDMQDMRDITKTGKGVLLVLGAFGTLAGVISAAVMTFLKGH